MRLLLDALLVPHAPVLLLEVNGRGCEEVLRALGRLPVEGVPVLVSPHARRDCVHEVAAGDLSPFGMPGVTVEVSSEEPIARELADAWARRVDDPLDHGHVVPLRVLALRRPVVAAGLSEDGGSDVGGLATALASLGSHTDITVIASAHGAASLSDRAPLTDRPAGHSLQGAIDSALEADLSDLLEIPDELWAEGGCCSRSTLELLGMLLPGRRFEIAARAEPFGVAYRAGRLA